MGKGSGSGFHGTPGSNATRAFADNLPALTEKFPLHGQHFGEVSDRKNSSARVIHSKNPERTAEEFFRLATRGGDVLYDSPTRRTVRLKDRTTITYRVISSSDGSPAVDLKISEPSFIRTRKIHFIKER